MISPGILSRKKRDLALTSVSPVFLLAMQTSRSMSSRSSVCFRTFTMVSEFVNILKICSTVPVSAKRIFFVTGNLIFDLFSSSEIFCNI